MSRHLVIMAAGTGGHVIPGIAVARELRSRGWTVSWLGTTHGMENRLVPAAGIALDAITFRGVRGKGPIDTLTSGLRMLVAFWSCLRILSRRRPAVVLGMGGYVCFPGGMMASLLGKPLMLVNADASLLLSNKALLPVADRIAFGLPGAATPKKNAVVTGNPVRAEIEALPTPEQRFAGRDGALRLLVVGGSLGAKAINDCVPQAIAMLPIGARPRITHQSGEAHLQALRASYASMGIEADVQPFIDDMAAALGDCDVMICRAGAVTVSELCAAGVAAILVPLVVSTTAHQRDNAQWLAAHGAGIHLPQGDMSPKSLAELLGSLTRESLLAMASKARSLAMPKAAERVADELEGLVPA
jgi:UDP-N-acetylglucosamine--N-acetylmuramyl-(pentapeptide) pyrophosphoryl-undecaprenol N-acetylglucosamine transferase